MTTEGMHVSHPRKRFLLPSAAGVRTMSSRWSTVLPLLFVFLFLQRRLVQAIAQTGIKG